MEDRHGVSNVLFASVTVVLLIVAASGFLLNTTGLGSTKTETTTVTMTETMTHSTSSSTTTETMMNETNQHAVAFVPAHGQMISGGWLIVAPLGNGSYAVAIHTQGLEPPSMGDYIVEAAQNSGEMKMVPIGGTTNATLSEFMTDSHGSGEFFIILNQSPSSSYENVSIVFLPGMQMQNATVVATAPLTTMMSSSSSSTSSSTHT